MREVLRIMKSGGGDFKLPSGFMGLSNSKKIMCIYISRSFDYFGYYWCGCCNDTTSTHLQLR